MTVARVKGTKTLSRERVSAYYLLFRVDQCVLRSQRSSSPRASSRQTQSFRCLSTPIGDFRHRDISSVAHRTRASGNDKTCASVRSEPADERRERRAKAEQRSSRCIQLDVTFASC